MDGFEDFARAGLRAAGVPFTDDDLQLLAVVAQVIDPGMRALDELDLQSAPLEPALDPGRAPLELPA